MAHDLFSRYIWLIDTLRNYGSLTRTEINKLWMRSPYSNGTPLPRRTFYTYRNAIEDLFKLNIECNPSTFEYYIANADSHYESVISWLLNSAAIGNLLNDARDVASRIFLEDVPSARRHLPVVVDALKENRTLRVTYHAYTRTVPTPDILLEPYFLKIFRQRWYITGRNVRDNQLKTYALDRIVDCQLTQATFAMPEDFDPEEYFANSFGIIFDEGTVKDVSIRTSPRQAKYFRSVPLHHSQREVIHDSYSIFTYRLRITPDFVAELLSYGPKITVTAPAELRAMIAQQLRESLDNYQ